MSPSQESVDKYLHDNFPPSELEKYRADLRAKVAALRWNDPRLMVHDQAIDEVLALLDGETNVTGT
jgi:hypothetical protein